MARPEGQSHLCEAGPARLSASPLRQAPVCTALDTGASTGSQAGLPLTHENKGRGELTCPSAPGRQLPHLELCDSPPSRA